MFAADLPVPDNDDVDAGPGLGCISPEQSSIIDSHVAKVIPIRQLAIIVVNIILAFVRFPFIIS